MLKRSTSLVILTISIAAIAAGVASAQKRIKQPLPSGLQNLAESKVIEVRDAAGQVVLNGTFATTADSKSEIERTATLSGANSRAKGKAEIELVQQGSAITKQELEFQVEGLASSTSFRLFVDGNDVASFTTSGSGKAQLKFSSKYTK
jgi:hypothetical protein